MSTPERTTIAVAIAALACAAISPALAADANRQPVVMQAAHHDVSRPLRDLMREAEASTASSEEVTQGTYVVPNLFPKPSRSTESNELMRELGRMSVQNAPINVPAPSVILSTDGMQTGTGANGAGSSIPPDTNGDIGLNEYIQWLNTRYAIFNRTTGARTTAPANGSTLFAGFGGRCQTTNAGDPIALWDDIAQRWVLSQFTTAGSGAANAARQCVAISTSADPLGTYYRYEFIWPYGSTSTYVFGDYPHFGVWHDASGTQDAYLLVTHEFIGSGQAFGGAAFTAMQRDKMLNGEPAAMVRFPGFDAYGAMPVHLEGENTPKAGACPVFMHYGSNGYRFWDLCLDWSTPANSTISTEQFIASGTPFLATYDDIPQAGTTSRLDNFGSNLMNRANARAFPAGAPNSIALVATHVAKASNEAPAGARWVQVGLRHPKASYDRIYDDAFDPIAPTPLAKDLLDEGLYQPDSDHRWLSSINIDKSGNIGMGYNVSSATLNPKLRITGRTIADPAGLMRDEVDCTPATTGSQTGLFSGRGRWGDYAAMGIDPADECTFWFTGEYYPNTANSTWYTRICTFKFDNCGQPEFAVATETPVRIEMCGATAAADPSWGLLAGSLNGFNGAVSLSTSGVPGGATPSFSVNPVTQAPGLSTLTLTNGRTLASGEYTFSVIGTSGAETRTRSLELGLSSNAPATPILATPANGAVDVKVRPILSWNAVPGALTYKVDVASDAAFTTLVTTKVVKTTSWAVDVTLSNLTQYYWRVQPTNYCGDGVVSSVSSFTTGVPGTCPAGTTATTLFSDDFQSGVNGWTTDGSGGTQWSQQTPPAATNMTTTAWGIPNNSVTGDRGLISPAITIPANAAAVFLKYDGFHNFEDDGPTGCWDNATLQIKAGVAAGFTTLTGERMFTDPYTGVVSDGEANAGEHAWCHKTNPSPRAAIVDLDGFNGQSVQLRFRHVSDANTTAAAPNGMYIDNFTVEACTP